MKKLIAITILSFTLVWGQETTPAEKDSLHFVFEPDSLFLHVGETGIKPTHERFHRCCQGNH